MLYDFPERSKCQYFASLICSKMPSYITPVLPPSLPARFLAGVMFLAPAIGFPGELVLQDTLKSAVVALGVLAAALVFFWQRRDGAAALRWHIATIRAAESLQKPECCSQPAHPSPKGPTPRMASSL